MNKPEVVAKCKKCDDLDIDESEYGGDLHKIMRLRKAKDDRCNCQDGWVPVRVRCPDLYADYKMCCSVNCVSKIDCKGTGKIPAYSAGEIAKAIKAKEEGKNERR